MIDNTMTPARHRRKPGHFLPGLIGVALLLGLALPLLAATTEYIVVDRNSGLAINGFDPVAYFTDATARLGRDDLEYRFAGAVWRFRNEGNRAAFSDNPEIYMPHFGGYDPVGVARGVAVPGDPRLWRITGGRLYLFHTAASREAFADNPDGVIATADREWPKVRLTLMP